jgi:hypothetical protein
MFGNVDNMLGNAAFYITSFLINDNNIKKVPLGKPIYIDISIINPNGIIATDKLDKNYKDKLWISWNEYLYKENDKWKLKENEIHQFLFGYILSQSSLKCSQ